MVMMKTTANYEIHHRILIQECSHHKSYIYLRADLKKRSLIFSLGANVDWFEPQKELWRIRQIRIQTIDRKLNITMANNNSFSFKMRIIHRYLGFFLVGIMAMYALSGIVLIFRDTDFLKQEVLVTKEIKSNATPEELGELLRIRGLEVEKEEGDLVYFGNGNYNKSTGVAEYTVKKLPMVLDRMTHLHKAKSADPLFFFNIFFGLSLLFFVVSSFWMFMPSTSVFRNGMYFVAGGILLTLILLFV